MLPKRTVEHKSEYVRVADNGKLYSSMRWKVMRRRQLMREPLCAECKAAGVIKAATDVDHIKPHKGDLRLFFDENNLQSLCHSCHSRKTAAEDGGWGRVRAR